MNSLVPHIDIDLVHHLKKKYFGDKSKRLSIKKGEYLIRHDEINDRLFLVLDGLCAGYLESESGTRLEVFQSAKNMFVGVHSFFSKNRQVYADIVALKDCNIAYIEREDLHAKENLDYNADFMPLIVLELSIRQRWAKDVALENESTMKKLYHSDKMATLGQMAAGLAHELNNAIGVIHGNTDWMAKEVRAYFKLHEPENIFNDYVRGFEKGQYLASNEVRERKRKIERKFSLPTTIAKLAAKIGFTDVELKGINKEEVSELIEKKHKFWQFGVALHDVLLASNQAAHVLKSIKQLSVSDQARHAIDINQSINEALVLIKNIIREVTLEVNMDESLPTLSASGGELIQIWVNIIKNACESMINSAVEKPVLGIKTLSFGNNVVVEISDNGPGISTALKQKIFQPNFTTKKGGLSFGLGLGLSIVLKLVDGYDGKIEVDSKKGRTTFSVILPVNRL